MLEGELYNWVFTSVACKDNLHGRHRSGGSVSGASSRQDELLHLGSGNRTGTGRAELSKVVHRLAGTEHGPADRAEEQALLLTMLSAPFRTSLLSGRSLAVRMNEPRTR